MDKRGSVITETIDRLKTMIVAGEFTAGQRLPTERDLAARLGVSRSSLREAIRALTLLGVLEARQGDGTYVTSLAPHLLLDAVAMLVELSPAATVLDLLSVRRVLESAAAAQAAAHITDAQLAALAACLEEMRHDPQRGDGSVDEVVAADVRFHEIVTEAAGNAVLAALIGALSGRTLRARVWRGHADQGVFARSIGEHEAIYQALRDRDATRAAAVAGAHIAAVEAFFRDAPERVLPGAGSPPDGVGPPPGPRPGAA
ncbi:FadR/GntR family transcriptional regulator [Actinomadura hibisca]|uniref:FadR/GntR family transcriptional regulator n=1 Tax=Actinomadura hibisca TaxID=68565 RepID=UPI000836D5CA|nr:FCD domain-containing protein [Actinomadura hibisca]